MVAASASAGPSTRYELAWSMPYADVGDGKLEFFGIPSNNSWWFDADFVSGTLANAYL